MQAMKVIQRFPGLPRALWFSGIIIVLCIALYLRVFEIADRPLHSDEGVNYFFAEQMLREGYYHYSHENYHGPTYFYLLMFFHYFFGSEELWHRMSAILPGLLTVALPVFVASLISIRAVLTIAAFFALSSSMIFHARYSIHESLLVLTSLWFLFALFRWLERRESAMLVHLGIALSILIATKETFIIPGFAVFVTTFLLYSPKRVFSQLYRHSASFYWGLFWCFVVLLLFFTGFFQHSQSLLELFLGVPQWIGRGHSDQGHHKPYWYYYNLIRDTEPVVLLALLPALFWLYRIIFAASSFLLKRKDGSITPGKLVMGLSNCFYGALRSAQERVMVGASLYAIVSFLVYSYVPYKTPWLIINITMPAALATALFLVSIRPKILSTILIVAALTVSLKYALEFNFSDESIQKNTLGRAIYPYLTVRGSHGPKNPFSYVHTTRGMVNLASDIDAYLGRSVGGRVLVGTSSYWPLPYYLRRYSTRLSYGYTSPPEKYLKDYSVLILDHTVKFEHPDWQKKYYRLGDHIECHAYFHVPK